MLSLSASGDLFFGMDNPSRHGQAHRSSLDLPAINIEASNSSDRSRMSNRETSYHPRVSSTNASNPMTIPNLRDPDPPPALPPPKFVPVDQEEVDSVRSSDPGWHWGHFREETHHWARQSSNNSGSSLYGSGSFQSSGKGSLNDRPTVDRRGSSASTIKGSDDRRDSHPPRVDEGYASLSTASGGSNRSIFDGSLPRIASLNSSVHEKFITKNAHAYDKSVLDKLHPRKGSDGAHSSGNYSRTSFSSSLNDVSPTSRIAQEHQDMKQKPLSLPVQTTRLGSTDSPLSRWAEGGVVSPRQQFPPANFTYRTSTGEREEHGHPSQHVRRSASRSGFGNDDVPSGINRSNRGSYDRNQHAGSETEFPMEETSQLRRLHIDDSMTRPDSQSPGSAAGQKRRASSPLREDMLPALHTVSSENGLYRRREILSRGSPTPRLHSNHGSISSTASGPRNNSTASTLSLDPSSATTASYGRLSPGNPSPGGFSPGGVSPGAISPRSVDPTDVSLGAALAYHPRQMHQRPVSDSRPMITARKSSEGLPLSKGTSKYQGGYVCECCPKKPKKFETAEELANHESEKQYECQYCKNRFKNKNEAERHQNSLHLRRSSWSCAALTEYSAAFHTSITRPMDADTCGYCGEEYPRTGSRLAGQEGRVPTDHDWDIRIKHLIDVHKFGECNHAKKFFRADHFRQHLKHSHAGTSGKWTNQLELACQKEEPLPEPIRGPSVIQIGGRPGRINEEDEL